MEAGLSTRHQISHTVVNVKRVVIVFQVKSFEEGKNKKESKIVSVCYLCLCVYLEVEFTLLLLMIRGELRSKVLEYRLGRVSEADTFIYLFIFYDSKSERMKTLHLTELETSINNIVKF